MQDSESKELLKEVTDSARSKPIQVGNKFEVAQKFDDSGEPLTNETFDARKHLKRLSMDDLRFLKAWREAEWNTAKALEKTALTEDQAKRLVKRLTVFKQEELRVKALADIITPAQILTRHWDNTYTDELTDGQRDSLKETAKIVGAYKPNTSTVNINATILQMPRLSPEALEKLKALGDSQADVIEGEIAA